MNFDRDEYARIKLFTDEELNLSIGESLLEEEFGFTKFSLDDASKKFELFWRTNKERLINYLLKNKKITAIINSDKFEEVDLVAAIFDAIASSTGIPPLLSLALKTARIILRRLNDGY